MSSLLELQRRTLFAITRGQGAGLRDAIVAGPIPAHLRLLVYANNWRETSRKTLAAGYPVVQELVGSTCFRNLSRLYATRCPSGSGDLARFGSRFPEFLNEFYGGTEFAFLASVAELEWACAESLEASDAAPIDANTLRGIVDSDLSELRFTVHPSVRLVSAPVCVFSIWQAHQAQSFPVIDMNAPGENVLVYRTMERVVLRPIDGPTLAFIAELATGGAVVRAQLAATALDGHFDPASVLQELYCAGLLVGFSHPSHGDHCNVRKETH